MIVMERYVRQIEPHFHQHLDKPYRDNVKWDYFSKSPTPKASYLRWCRWRCYFINRYHRYHRYTKVPYGFQDDVIPRDNEVDLKDIVFWEQIPLWKRGPHDNFLPLTRIRNNCARDQMADHLSHRHTRLTAFLQRPDFKWGSVAQKNRRMEYQRTTHGVFNLNHYLEKLKIEDGVHE